MDCLSDLAPALQALTPENHLPLAQALLEMKKSPKTIK
jgi:hypothetical protein